MVELIWHDIDMEFLSIDSYNLKTNDSCEFR